MCRLQGGVEEKKVFGKGKSVKEGEAMIMMEVEIGVDYTEILYWNVYCMLWFKNYTRLNINTRIVFEEVELCIFFGCG